MVLIYQSVGCLQMSGLSQRMQRTVRDMKHYDVILDIHEFIHTRKPRYFGFLKVLLGLVRKGLYELTFSEITFCK